MFVYFGLKFTTNVGTLCNCEPELLYSREGGGLSYKNEGGARRKFWKEPLKGTRTSISGRGPK